MTDAERNDGLREDAISAAVHAGKMTPDMLSLINATHEAACRLMDGAGRADAIIYPKESKNAA